MAKIGGFIWGFCLTCVICIIPFGFIFIPAGAMFIGIFMILPFIISPIMSFKYFGSGNPDKAIGAISVLILLLIVPRGMRSYYENEQSEICKKSTNSLPSIDIYKFDQIVFDSLYDELSHASYDPVEMTAVLRHVDVISVRRDHNGKPYLKKTLRLSDVNKCPRDSLKGRLLIARNALPNIKLDMCLLEVDSNYADDTKIDAIIFRDVTGSKSPKPGSCRIIDVIQRKDGAEKAVGQTRYLTSDFSLYPEIRDDRDLKSKGWLISVIQKVLGSDINEDRLKLYGSPNK